MNWTQVIDPFNSIALSALIAVVPILFIFWALIIKKMKGYKASLIAIAIAILIAIPLAWWAGNRWLQDFAFRVPVKIYVFIITALVTVLIALCTVGYHSVKTALMNPVKSLKTE